QVRILSDLRRPLASLLFSSLLLSRPLRHLHSFPTRRSSDLLDERVLRRAVALVPVTEESIGEPRDGSLVELDEPPERLPVPGTGDRKSTRLNSSHEWISYAVFCLKKKKKQTISHTSTDSHPV